MAEHWTPEDMRSAGHDIVDFEDLDALDDAALVDVMNICEVSPETDAENCVPCRAYFVIRDRMNDVDGVTGQPETPETPDLPKESTHAPPVIRVTDPMENLNAALNYAKGRETPRAVELIDSLRKEVINFYDPTSTARQAGFTPQELALLVVGGKNYVEQTDALMKAGWNLTDDQKAIIENVRVLVERMSP